MKDISEINRMKKLIIKLSVSIVLITVIIVLLNIKVTTRKGINFQVQTIRLLGTVGIRKIFERKDKSKSLNQNNANEFKGKD